MNNYFDGQLAITFIARTHPPPNNVTDFFIIQLYGK